MNYFNLAKSTEAKWRNRIRSELWIKTSLISILVKNRNLTSFSINKLIEKICSPPNDGKSFDREIFPDFPEDRRGKSINKRKWKIIEGSRNRVNVEKNSPVYSTRSSVSRQQGWMVAYGTITRMIDNFHRNVLTAERQDIEIYFDAFVQRQNFGQSHSFASPSLDFEDRCVIGLGGRCYNSKETVTDLDVNRETFEKRKMMRSLKSYYSKFFMLFQKWRSMDDLTARIYSRINFSMRFHTQRILAISFIRNRKNSSDLMSVLSQKFVNFRRKGTLPDDSYFKLRHCRL